MAHATPLHRLASAILGRPLEEWVRERRADGMSWRVMAHDLYADTDRQVSVSFETLRAWFPDENGDEGEAA